MILASLACKVINIFVCLATCMLGSDHMLSVHIMSTYICMVCSACTYTIYKQNCQAGELFPNESDLGYSKVLLYLHSTSSLGSISFSLNKGKPDTYFILFLQ
ncbi:hypothetical protein I3843_01G047500 [Carya illinoinensis]|nr:hypothetical protein I3843_01G047500 [Carya illinoinensis]